MILFDRFDGLPLLVAVDGKAWVYNLITGHITLLHAEPQMLVRAEGDTMRNVWGFDGTDPSGTSTTIDFDPKTANLPPDQR